MRACPKVKKCSGYTLMEVLISMVILAIGLFGLATLQTVSMRANNSAYQRSIASMLAYDMLDRMRINYKGARENQYSNGVTPNPAQWDNASVSTPLKNCVSGDACNSAELADFDIWEWTTKDYKLQQLPDAAAKITTLSINSGNALNITIKITWSDYNTTESKGFGNQTTQSFVYSSIIRSNY